MSTFGKLFRVTTYGESHCKSVGVIVEGCPGGIPLSESDIQVQLDRRRPGQSNLTSPRNEKDLVSINSGTEMGYTLGTPISLSVNNLDFRPQDYHQVQDVGSTKESRSDISTRIPRPSHADYTYLCKYGVKASSGGGRSSARETIGRVAAAAVAEKFLSLAYPNLEIIAFVSRVGNVSIAPDNSIMEQLCADSRLSRSNVESSGALRTLAFIPSETIGQMKKCIERAKSEDDSIGGMVTCVIRNLPPGLGEPCFDKFEAMLAHAMMSIPATKGFELGSGFECIGMRGSVHNDPFSAAGDDNNPLLGTETNRSGGIQGGISNGQNVYFNVAFKPPATIGKSQSTCQYDGNPTILEAKGRHDPCVVPRAVPIVEAMTSLVVTDLLMIQLAREASLIRVVKNGSELQIPAALNTGTEYFSERPVCFNWGNSC